MKFTWLTQAGCLFENENVTVLVDPYLSDSVGALDPAMRRRIPVDESFFDISPDVIVLTHSHLDHTDPETLGKYLSRADKRITVLAAEEAFSEVRKLGGGHNYVLFAPHTVWNQNGVTFYAVKAEHSDRTAIGVILDDGDKTFYCAGDTLYNFDVIDDVLDLVETGVDYAFVPINGVGNNMNAKDAADFAYELGAHKAVPVHYGLFDELDPLDFDFEDALVVEPYETVEL